MLKAISKILNRKLANLATKDDVSALKNIINQQRLKSEILEAKLMKKYKLGIMGLEKEHQKIMVILT